MSLSVSGFPSSFAPLQVDTAPTPEASPSSSQELVSVLRTRPSLKNLFNRKNVYSKSPNADGDHTHISRAEPFPPPPSSEPLPFQAWRSTPPLHSVSVEVMDQNVQPLRRSSWGEAKDVAMRGSRPSLPRLDIGSTEKIHTNAPPVVSNLPTPVMRERSAKGDFYASGLARPLPAPPKSTSGIGGTPPDSAQGEAHASTGRKRAFTTPPASLSPSSSPPSPPPSPPRIHVTTPSISSSTSSTKPTDEDEDELDMATPSTALTSAGSSSAHHSYSYKTANTRRPLPPVPPTSAQSLTLPRRHVSSPPRAHRKKRSDSGRAQISFDATSSTWIIKPASSRNSTQPTANRSAPPYKLSHRQSGASSQSHSRTKSDHMKYIPPTTLPLHSPPTLKDKGKGKEVIRADDMPAGLLSFGYTLPTKSQTAPTSPRGSAAPTPYRVESPKPLSPRIAPPIPASHAFPPPPPPPIIPSPPPHSHHPHHSHHQPHPNILQFYPLEKPLDLDIPTPLKITKHSPGSLSPQSDDSNPNEHWMLDMTSPLHSHPLEAWDDDEVDYRVSSPGSPPIRLENLIPTFTKSPDSDYAEGESDGERALGVYGAGRYDVRGSAGGANGVGGRERGFGFGNTNGNGNGNGGAGAGANGAGVNGFGGGNGIGEESDEEVEVYIDDGYTPDEDKDYGPMFSRSPSPMRYAKRRSNGFSDDEYDSDFSEIKFGNNPSPVEGKGFFGRDSLVLGLMGELSPLSPEGAPMITHILKGDKERDAGAVARREGAPRRAEDEEDQRMPRASLSVRRYASVDSINSVAELKRISVRYGDHYGKVGPYGTQGGSDEGPILDITLSPNRFVDPPSNRVSTTSHREAWAAPPPRTEEYPEFFSDRMVQRKSDRPSMKERGVSLPRDVLDGVHSSDPGCGLPLPLPRKSLITPTLLRRDSSQPAMRDPYGRDPYEVWIKKGLESSTRRGRG